MFWVYLLLTHWRSAQIFTGTRERPCGLVCKGNVVIVDMMLSVAMKVCCSAVPDVISTLLTANYLHVLPLIETNSRRGF